LLLVLAGVADPAAAQCLSKWGHPVFSIGWTPYDSINAGHGNIPGGPGFIPGYGYFPASGELRYPWMDGPGTPFDRRKLAVVPEHEQHTPSVEPIPADAALLILKVPAEAEVWINQVRTLQAGSYRRFIAPPLPAGRPLVYTVEAHWRIQDADLTRIEEVTVPPGGRVTLNFLTPEGWSGRKLSPP
jgi:uncharacterized protein (TIGR03000 family)